MVKFILITSQRTGSTYISNYLHNHLEIAMYEEVILNQLSTPGGLKEFAKDNKFYKFLFKVYNISLVRRVHAKLPFYFPVNIVLKKYLEHFFKRKKEYINDNNFFNSATNKLVNEPKALGFKLMANQVYKIPYLKKWIKDNDVKIIILKRKNILEKYVSGITRYKRNIAHSTKKVENVKITIDLNELKKYIENITNEYRKLDMFRKDKEFISIYYEEFFSNMEMNIEEIFRFLEVDEKQNCEKPQLKKLNSQSLDEIIENYNEVIQYLDVHKLKYIYNSVEV